MPGLGSATSPAVFSRGPGGEVRALHLAAQPLSLHKQPNARNPRLWAAAAVAGGAAALAARHWRRACRARSAGGSGAATRLRGTLSYGTLVDRR